MELRRPVQDRKSVDNSGTYARTHAALPLNFPNWFQGAPEMGEMWQALLSVYDIDPSHLAALQTSYFQQHAALWERMLGSEAANAKEPAQEGADGTGSEKS